MSNISPHSVVTRGGVHNKHTAVRSTLTLRDLYREYRHPKELDVESAEYHAADKTFRTNVKLRLPYFVGGVLDGPRADDNVVRRTLLTLDIEQKPKQETGPPAPGTVVKKIRVLGGEAWVYTSISHTVEHPRYRVVLPLRADIEGTDLLRTSTLAAARKLGIEEWCAPESWVLSQPMFLPVRLKGGTFQQWHVDGKAWKPIAKLAENDTAGIADIPDKRPDIMVSALKAAGLYLEQDEHHAGRHYFTCPWQDEHTTSNATQTVYFEPHFNGHSAWGCKCMGTGPDVDGKPHMTRGTLTRWLTAQGHMKSGDDVGEYEEYDSFLARSTVSQLLSKPPAPQLWAVKDFAPIGAVTMVAAPGGQGKSLMLLHIITHGALGLQWGPFRFDQPVKSLYVSYEDGPRQMYDRLMDIRSELEDAHGLLYDVKGALDKHVLAHRVDDPGTWLVLIKPDRFSAAERTERVDWLVGLIKRAGVQLVIFDPMVYTHQVPENDIADMALYMQTLNYLAREAACAVVVVHHMSKFGRGESLVDIDQHSLRGASSISDNARSAGALVGLPYKDAESYGVAEADVGRFAVFKHVKSNYGALLGTHVFEREGRLLRPRVDMVPMNGAVLRVAKEVAADAAKDERLGLYAVEALRALVEHRGGISQNQVAMHGGKKWNPQKTKAVLAWCEERELVECEFGGERRSGRHSITMAGRRWLRQNDK